MKVRTVETFRLRIPFRFVFRHRAAERSASDNLICRLSLENGLVGFGEGVPRAYVTGETVESAARTVERRYLGFLAGLDPSSFGEAAEAAFGLETFSEGRTVYHSARCAVELALLDAFGKTFRKRLDEAVPFRIQNAFSGGGVLKTRCGVIPATSSIRTKLFYLVLRRFLGFREFKLKMGLPGDEQRLRFLSSLSPKAKEGRIILRVDANGAWSADEALRMMERFSSLGVISVEQPLPPEDLEGLRRLRKAGFPVRVVLDESFRTAEEARALASAGLCDVIQVRISKNGGYLPSLEAARIAREHGLDYHAGAMIGESGILASAQGHFIKTALGLGSAEPSFNRLLLKRDIVKRRNLGRGIRGEQPVRGYGLGVEVEEKSLLKYARPLLKCRL